MIGYIYKITNIENNKIYIGQSKNDIQIRFKRHLYDAIDSPKPLNTKFARAIRKYGKDAFKLELIEEVNGTAADLTDREYYYINLYNTVVEGYNSTDARCRSGGNTYYGKSEQEMQIIKDKIANTKFSGKNPNAHAVKCLNIETNEVLYFETAEDATRYFGETNHQFVTRRCMSSTNRGTKKLYKEKYLFAYQEDDFITDYHIKLRHPKAKAIRVIDTNTQVQ